MQLELRTHNGGLMFFIGGKSAKKVLEYFLSNSNYVLGYSKIDGEKTVNTLHYNGSEPETIEMLDGEIIFTMFNGGYVKIIN